MPSNQQIEAACEAMHNWLTKPKSPLRGLLQILSSGGCFYAADIVERVARAAVSKEDLLKAVKARSAKKEAAGPPDADAMDMFSGAGAD